MTNRRDQHFRSEKWKDVTIVRLRDGQYTDRLIGGELKQQLVEFCDAENPRNLLVNFLGVRRFSSETINALISAREHVTAGEGKIALCELAPEIREAFQILKLEGRVFPIYATQQEALEDMTD